MATLGVRSPFAVDKYLEESELSLATTAAGDDLPPGQLRKICIPLVLCCAMLC